MAGKKYLAFDLETIADITMVSSLPEVKPNGSLKDPKKIEADILEKKKKQILEMGLNPVTNLICAVGWYSKSASGCLFLPDPGVSEKEKESEKKLLIDFWELAGEYDHFVTFNGRSFDMRCILLHGMEYGITPPFMIDHGRYNAGNHTDMRLVLSGNDPYAPGKLDTYAKKYLGEGKKEGIDGALVQSYYDMGLFDDISEYAEDDCRITLSLFQMAKAAGLVTT